MSERSCSGIRDRLSAPLPKGPAPADGPKGAEAALRGGLRSQLISWLCREASTLSGGHPAKPVTIQWKAKPRNATSNSRVPAGLRRCCQVAQGRRVHSQPFRFLWDIRGQEDATDPNNPLCRRLADHWSQQHRPEIKAHTRNSWKAQKNRPKLPKLDRWFPGPGLLHVLRRTWGSCFSK